MVDLGEPQDLGDPVEHDGLELCDGGRADPVEAGAGEGGRVQLAQQRGVRGRAGEEGEEVGRLPVRQPGDDLAVDILADHVPGLALLRRRFGQNLAQVARLDLRDDAVVCDVLIVVDDCGTRQWISRSRVRSQRSVTASTGKVDLLWSIEAFAASLNCRLSILVVWIWCVRSRISSMLLVNFAPGEICRSLSDNGLKGTQAFIL